jgi:hypothetical protein
MKRIHAIPALILLFAATGFTRPQSGQDDGKLPPGQGQQVQQQRPPDGRSQQPQQRTPNAQAQQPQPQRPPDGRAQQPQQQRTPNAQAQQPQPQRPPGGRAQQQQQRPPNAQVQQPQQHQGQPDIKGRQPPPQRTQDQARAWQQQKGWVQKGGWQGNRSWQQNRAHNWTNQHQNWGQRGGYGGYYIPQNLFVLSFGSSHFFRMVSRPTMYLGYPRFRYGGFSFLMVDPWPEYWGEDWYATDDVYVDYDDGYYLYNRRYPGVGLAITVVL